MDPENVEILVHTAAPTTKLEDDRHRKLALSYFDFECSKRHNLTRLSQPPPINRSAQNCGSSSKDVGTEDEPSISGPSLEFGGISSQSNSGLAIRSEREASELFSSAEFLDAPQGTGRDPSDSGPTVQNPGKQKNPYSKKLLMKQKENSSQNTELSSNSQFSTGPLGYRNSKRFRPSSHPSGGQSQFHKPGYDKLHKQIPYTESSGTTESGIRGPTCTIALDSQLPLSYGLKSPHTITVSNTDLDQNEHSKHKEGSLDSFDRITSSRTRDERADETSTESTQQSRETNVPSTAEEVSRKWERISKPKPSGSPDFSALEFWVDSPAPKTSTKKVSSLPSQLTPTLAKLKANSALATRYNPKSTARPVVDGDRGYWQFRACSWPVKLQYDFWVSMKEFLKRGDAGMATWMTREPVHDNEPHLGMVSVWCWGELVEHIWLLLYVMSKGFTKKVDMAWYDGSQCLIVQMPVK